MDRSVIVYAFCSEKVYVCSAICMTKTAYDLLVYCTSNGTQFFVFKILHEGFYTLQICMRIDIAKPELYLNFGRK